MTSPRLRLRELLARLVEADVRFVLVGGLAVNAWGYLRATRDVDLVPDPSPESALEAEAKDVELGGLQMRVCSLEHLLAMKRASERPRDRDDLEALEAAHGLDSSGA